MMALMIINNSDKMKEKWNRKIQRVKADEFCG